MLLVISRLCCLLPVHWLIGFGRLMGRLWYYMIPIRIKVAKYNVDKVYGTQLSKKTKHRLIREACENLSMTVAETFRLPILAEDLANHRMEIQGMEILHNIHKSGKGIVLTSLHLGNFEMAIGAIALEGLPLHVIFKDIKSKSAHKFWNQTRQTTGVKAIPPRGSKEQIIDILNQGGIVSFAVDQHMAKYRSIVCEFLGNLAATTPAPHRFALECNAEMVAAWTYRNPDNPTQHILKFQHLKIESPYKTHTENIRHNTQKLQNYFAEIVKKYPQQWLWHHKRFKVQDNPDGWDIPPKLKHLITTQQK